MSVDDSNLYDEHKDVRGFALEKVTVDTKISSSNRGFALLAKMGWTEGKPVGVSGDGMWISSSRYRRHVLTKCATSRKS